MGPIDALLHLFGFVVPALTLGAVTAGLAKLAWRRELRTARWTRLAGLAATAALAVQVAGLVVFGRDGMMATYAGMIVAVALTLAWASVRR